ncbi:uncharacterized protein LOC114712337 [Neltuma alba]|uniref:uncharacterized protein LOC114712337 n=1 Tax=Neltuma alba TaxID=207710 RepID=UPI0010A36DD9|nr:uncharacterized protein LOC114712337 [Prosopis alba]
MDGSFKDEFAKLEAYCHKLSISNPGSDVEVEVSNEALEQASLELENGGHIIIMSDMQKGLLSAASEVLPEAEHRLCARHIYANWSKQWRGKELKKMFFSCAWSTFEEQFNDNMKELGRLRKQAAQAAVTYNPTAWVRAFFTARCQTWMVDNNVSESLNAWIHEYRFLPVIRMFDGIRLKMMEKWADSTRIVSTWKGDYSSKCLELFEANRFIAATCRVSFNGDEGYEVSEGQDRHTVYLNRRMCTCRPWDLTGIPCQHAICALSHAKIDPMTQISRYYHKDMFLASYMTKLQPVRGRQLWDTNRYLPMQPLPFVTLPGRLTKKRVRTEEPQRRKKMSSAQNAQVTINELSAPLREKLSKKGSINRCSLCRQQGHNKSTCKEVVSV